jgi:hypothetical protein
VQKADHLQAFSSSVKGMDEYRYIIFILRCEPRAHESSDDPAMT